MTNPMVKIHNAETGEVIEREMNAQELAQWQKEKTEKEAEEQTKIEQAAAKQALLNKLGITQEEAALLLGGN
jgi:hypothetical protein